MESVLSKSSNGMYKLFKKTLNKYSNYSGQLFQQIRMENTKGMSKEHLALLGLSQMTHLLYDKSLPLRDSEIFEAI